MNKHAGTRRSQRMKRFNMVSESAALTEMNGLALSRTCFGILLLISTQFNRENSHAFAEALNWMDVGNQKPRKEFDYARSKLIFCSKEASWINYRAAWYPSLTEPKPQEFVLFVPGHNKHRLASISKTIHMERIRAKQLNWWWLTHIFDDLFSL